MTWKIFSSLTWLCVALPFTEASFADSLTISSLSRTQFPLSETYSSHGEPADLAYGKDFTRMTAVDEEAKIIYVLGRQRITVLAINNNTYMSLLVTQNIYNNYTGIHIDICAENVVISTKEGYIVIYKAYSIYMPNQLFVANIASVDRKPVHFQIFNNCSKIILSIKGVKKQPGKIAFLNFEMDEEMLKYMSADEALIYGRSTVKYVTFDNIDFRRIVKQGYVLNKNTPQPNWISVNGDETKAYISMTINNAIAIVSLETDNLIDVLPMDYKEWSEGNDGFDCNSDGSIDIKNSPVYAVYNPDQIVIWNVDGEDVLFTANAANFKGTKVPLYKLKVEDDLIREKKKALENCPKLKVVPVESTDYDGNGYADRIATFGGRSLSMIQPFLTGFELLHDTGSDFENAIEEHFPEGFNSHPNANETLADSFDSTSTTFGPNIEGLAVAEICGGQSTMVVAGAKSPGTVHVYIIDKDQMQFREKLFLDAYMDKHSIYNDEQLKSKNLLWMKHIKSIHIMYSNTDTPWIVVGSATISTITVYKLNVGCPKLP